MGVIESTVIAIGRPGGNNVNKHVVYNGHKRKHAIKYQTITAPCATAMHLAGPIEAHKHDWTLYVQSGVYSVLPVLLRVGDTQYSIYGNSGYSSRVFFEVTYSRSTLSKGHMFFDKAISGSRLTAEWFFKEVKMCWTVVDFKSRFRLGESAIGKFYIAAMLLTNL